LKGFIQNGLTAFGLILYLVFFAVYFQALVEGPLKGSASMGELEVPVVLDCVVTSSQ